MFTQSKSVRKGVDLRPAGLEKTARAEIVARTGRTLSDAEWERGCARLLEFVTILRAWNRKTGRNGSW